jgi:hypothetical protein
MALGILGFVRDKRYMHQTEGQGLHASDGGTSATCIRRRDKRYMHQTERIHTWLY